MVAEPSQYSAGIPGVVACRILLGGVDMIDYVVRNPAPLCLRGFGGTDVEPSVDLHGIEVDDLPLKAVSQFQR